VPKDEAEAAKWYRKAADQGDANSQTLLGVMYAVGRGVPKDEAEAVKWYRKAADQEDAKAQTLLGLMYETGLGVPKDKTEAYKWYLLAGAQGNEQAKKNISIIEGNITPAQRTEGQRRAREWKPRKP
jgi:TPR repeat protein